MKKKTIIQTCGINKSGKTETIRMVYNELQKRLGNESEITLSGEVMNKIFIYKGLKICLDSMGDDLYYKTRNFGSLEKRLNYYLKEQKCDLLICAGRYSNNVVKRVDKLAKEFDYRLVKNFNYKLDRKKEDKETLSKYNLKSANQLLELIDDIIEGKM